MLSCFELALHGACDMGLPCCARPKAGLEIALGGGEWVPNLVGSGLGIRQVFSGHIYALLD